MSQPSVLVVDDDRPTLKLIAKVLELAGYEVAPCDTGAAALERMTGRAFDVAVVDLRMPGLSGLEVLREIKRRDPTMEVVMTTAYPEVATAVEALRQGAYDYLEKPLDLDELRHCMARVSERRFLRGEVRALQSRLGQRLAVQELVGVSEAMTELTHTIQAVAGTTSPVLIEGESGTGKELVAGAIHRLSPRSAKPFIPVNCGAIPSDLLESEFFGHVRGAFSGAIADTLGLFRSAHSGTIFLDEIGELPPALQAKLLRVLQAKEVRPVGSTKSIDVDVRVIAATNRALEEAIKDGSFRQDLFYRLNVVPIRVPPLRERPDDIEVLVTHFLHQFNERFGREVRGVSPEAMTALRAYDFPGNVRELENLLERAYALGATREITAADVPALSVPPPAIHPAASRSESGDPDKSRPLPTISELERDLIFRAVERFPNDTDGAARAIGLSPRTMYRRLKEYGIR
jgi:DNA-binding NtrC family response regulator